MKCLIIFGLRMGSDNQALINLGAKIEAMGVDVSFRHFDDKTPFYAEVVIGHSFGGREAVDWSYRMISSNLPIRYLGLIDPVADWFPIQFWNFWKKFLITSNVQKADCFTRSWNIVPPSGSILNSDGQRYRNYPNINASHADIADNNLVSETILNQIRSLL